MLVNTIQTAFIAPSNLPSPMAEELANRHQMKDAALWEILQPSVTAQQQQRLETLNTFSAQRDLSSDERNEQQTLLEAHHLSVLRRAQAIAVLTLRGHVISNEVLAKTVA